MSSKFIGAGIVSRQYGHVPLVTPSSAATGMPHVGQFPICVFESFCVRALGLKHIVPTSRLYIRILLESAMSSL